MKISHTYKLFAVSITLLFIIIVVIVFKTLSVQDNVRESEDHRFRSYLLAIELFQSSEDLTRMARSYVSTGNPIYEKRYFEILDIRNGKLPRPAHYNSTYWHLAGIGKGTTDSGPGETISLKDLMRREGFTEQQLGLLQESQANSDHLVNMEKEAFAAMKGLYDDGHGNLTVRGAPNRDYAVRLLYSEKYFDEKALIMAPIRKFMDAIDTRTKATLIADESSLRQYIMAALVFVIIALSVVAIKTIHTFRSILRPLERLSDQVAEIESGNYAARCSSSSKNEIGVLCAHFSNMAQALEMDINERRKIEESLANERQRLSYILEGTNVGTWEWNVQTGETVFNERWAGIIGYTLTELAPVSIKTWEKHAHPDDLAVSNDLLEKHFRNELPYYECEVRMLHKNGSYVWILDRGKVSKWTDEGKPLIISGTHQDITARKEAEEILKKSEEQVRLLLNSTAEAIYGIDLQGNCTFANPSCLRMLGYAATEQLLGKNMHRLIHHSYPDGRPMAMEDCNIYKAFREGLGVHQDDEVLWRADSSSFPVEYWSYPQIANGVVSGAVVAFIDITERKKAEETIRHLANHDGLTDLPNLRLAEDRVVMALAAAHRNNTLAAVMFIDLDGFKTINDTLGHDAGDYVLREVANRLVSSVRETDTVARVGGDEFLLVAVELHSPDNAAVIARKVVYNVSQPIVFNGHRAAVGASIGIALYPNHGEDINELIKRADEAMYVIKNSGKNGFGFAASATQ